MKTPYHLKLRVPTNQQINQLPSSSKATQHQERNVDLGFHFKFTYTFKKSDNCVIATSNEKTDYYCTYCVGLRIKDYTQFKAHIESNHLKDEIAYSRCHTCMQMESIDEFEYHIMQNHLRDQTKSFCFSLMCLDKSVYLMKSRPCFFFNCLIKDNKREIQACASPSWKFICNDCKQFRKISTLQSHLEEIHQMRLTKIACNKCGDILKALIDLPKHALSHHRYHVNIAFFMNFTDLSQGMSVQQGMIVQQETSVQHKNNNDNQIVKFSTAKRPRIDTTIFTFSYDIDTTNDHCVVARYAPDSLNPLSCRLCQFKYIQLTHLEKHIESRHIHDKISYCICEKCCTVFDCLEEIPQHIQSIHSEIAKTHVFQFKLISLKTSVLEDVEEGLPMEELLPPLKNGGFQYNL